MNKCCSKCKKIKPLNLFKPDKQIKSGFSSWCKQCTNIDRHRRYILNKEKELKEAKIRYEKIRSNSELSIKLTEARRNWQRKNKDKCRTYSNKYRKENLEKVKSNANKLHNERYKNDAIFRFTRILKKRISYFLIKKKEDTAFDNIIGCTKKEFKTYFESKFTDGMNWSNYGNRGWHIDHIIPISSAKTLEEAIKLCHHTNLQPLWWLDNIKKGGVFI